MSLVGGKLTVYSIVLGALIVCIGIATGVLVMFHDLSDARQLGFSWLGAVFSHVITSKHNQKTGVK